MVFQGNYLRVYTLKTVDGTTPALVDGQLSYKEEFLPLSARPFLERQNKDLPEILKKKIELVTSEQPVKESKATKK